jgi:predicted DNA-binding transcriptional regulator YafY
MANTSSRTLRLLSLLQTHRYWPGPELADRLEVSVRTLRRDVDRLRELGYPVEANRGVDGGYQLAAGAAMPPLVLDDEEAVALAVGLQAAANGGVAGVAEASVRALAKVIPVMPPRLRRRVEALRSATVPASWGDAPGPGVDPGVLTALAQACRDTERVEFGYVAADGAATARLAEPFRLVSLGRRWYLVAYDLHRHGWRSFRLDRIEAPRSTGARFRPRDLPAADAAAFVRAGITHAAWTHAVEVLVAAPPAAVQETVGRWARLEDAGGGRTLLRMQADDLTWPAFALGSIGAEFTVVSPPELADLVAEWSARFGRAGTPGGGHPAADPVPAP